MSSLETLSPRLRRTALLLVLALLAAQWGMVQHEWSADSHQAGHFCEWCVAYTHGSAAALSVPPPPVAMHDVRGQPLSSPVITLTSFAYYAVRAPPR